MGNGVLTRKPPLSVACPKCGAREGDVCSSGNHMGGRSSVRPHRERLDAAGRELMTYEVAMAHARDGHRVREARMSKGWTVACFVSRPGDYFCVNPHTGSNYLYHPTDADKASSQWSLTS